MIAADRQSRLDNLPAKTCRTVNGGAIAAFILPLRVLCVFATLREIKLIDKRKFDRNVGVIVLFYE